MCICWMLALASSSNSLAATIALEAKAEQVDLSNSMTLLHDPTGKLHYTEVLAMGGEFRKVQRHELIRSFNAGVFWLRFSLAHSGPQPVTRWLVVGNPKINTVTLYLQSGTDWQAMSSGRSVPMVQKPVVSTDAAFPITLSPGQNREFLIRVVARSATDMATTLWEPQAYRFISGERKLLLIGMLSGVLVSSLLALIVFIRLREMPYLWMSLFLLAVVGVESARENLIGFYLWPDNSVVPLQVLSVFGGLAIFSLSKVIAHALDLPRQIAPADKLLLVVRWLAIGAVIFSGFDYGAGVRLLSITALVVHLAGLILPVVLWRRGIRSAGWFAIAFTLGLMLETSRQFANLGILPWASAMNFSLVGYLLAAPFILVGMIEQTRQLSEQLAVAQQLQQAKSAFLARVSHELRSPLNTILGFARMLRRGSARLSLRDGSTGIEKGALRLLGLIDELLDESRAAAGKLTVSPAPTFFKPWLDDVCETATLFSEAQGNRFICERSGELPTAVLIDSVRLRQVLENLLNNANRHTDKGKIRLHCSGWSENVMAVINFAVSDTGEGIAPERLNTIFEPFVRGEEAEIGDRRRRSGFGLGLSISRELIRQMGGDIVVSSTLHQGSRFSFTLRCRRVDPAMVAAPHEAEPEHDEPAQAPPPVLASATMANAHPRVLIVDDDPQQLQVLGDLLDQSGFVVQECAGGEAAAEVLTQGDHWDAIITDQMMADGNGWYLLQAVREREQRIPVMLLSAAKPLRPASLPNGVEFDAVLQKPSLSGDLLATLWALILKVGAGGTAISPDQWQALATLADDGEVSGIEEWIAGLGSDTLEKMRVTAWASEALYQLNLGLLEQVARKLFEATTANAGTL
jgi:signal transduction histidine kinase/CheY-like chemotaxis protein